ncbi:hypothetical protein SDC9_131129 [bioreactor metagenome]|uniref:Hydantoin racemase n=1 Tax=bioreactor metagenome TaxID=1076179 RepID=A0A645D4R2_9ZZZZ
MSSIQSGHAFYGQHIAVLVFSTTTPRLAGDAGNNSSFDFPVRYEIIEGGFSDLIKGSDIIRQRLVSAARNLAELGIRGIVGDCGLMSLYQKEIAQEGIPFVGSSLCLIPSVWQMVGRKGNIGILTGHSELLSKKHLIASGWDETINISIQGMENEPHFNNIVIQGGHELDPVQMRNDVLNGVDKLMTKTDDLSAIIIECSNLGTFSSSVYEKTRVPVLDVISCSILLERMINPHVFSER